MIPWTDRDRWTLRVGDSRGVLTAVLSETGPLDIFLHDSLHTVTHQLWEYEQGWAALRSGGLLLSDNCETGAFKVFCAAKQASWAIGHCVWRGPQFGLARKP